MQCRLKFGVVQEATSSLRSEIKSPIKSPLDIPKTLAICSTIKQCKEVLPWLIDPSTQSRAQRETLGKQRCRLVTVWGLAPEIPSLAPSGRREPSPSPLTSEPTTSAITSTSRLTAPSTRACRTSSTMAAPVVSGTSPNAPLVWKSTNRYYTLSQTLTPFLFFFSICYIVYLVYWCFIGLIFFLVN